MRAAGDEVGKRPAVMQTVAAAAAVGRGSIGWLGFGGEWGEGDREGVWGFCVEMERRSRLKREQTYSVVLF